MLLLDAADAVEKAIKGTIAECQVRTPDIGGKSCTCELGEAIAAKMNGDL